MSEVRNLEPKVVWNHFEDLNAVPRPSKKEERVIAFVKNFGESLGLPTRVDKVGNVIITKPATPGMEDRETVVLQGHIDMVHQKNNETEFDFETEGIRSFIDGEWVKADGTTLGADNGMGVAAAMAVLSSTDIAHPAIEALFTIDEETGMTGAIELAPGELTGRILLNMDTEEDNEITIGCAGGVDTNTKYHYDQEPVEQGLSAFKITVKGLQGGHSGMDIIKGLANANKLMNRCMWQAYARFGMRVASIDGGGLRNAIPRESNAVVVVSDVEGFKSHIVEMESIFKSEYRVVEPRLVVELTPVETPSSVMDPESQENMIRAIHATFNGVFRMSNELEGLVETSSNLARVLVKDGEFTTQSLQRSAVETQKHEVANTIASVYEMIGAEVEQGGDYPGWAPNPNSPILTMMEGLYKELFNEDPHVSACHAGLECGILGRHYDDMHMISYGPTIRGAHSPDERVNIASVKKFWDYTQEILKRIPTRAEMDALKN